MKIERIDHIHILVKDAEKAARAFNGVLGDPPMYFNDLTAEFGNRVGFHKLGIEVMQTTNSKTRIGKLLKGKPEGVVAISLKVPNIEEAIAELKSRGGKLVEYPVVGKVKQAWFEIPGIEGLYIELADYPGDDIRSAAGV